jgi:hypothetical protein
MPIEFRCTHCHTLLRTKEEAAGRSLLCPKCGQSLTVPSPEVRSPIPPPPGGGPAETWSPGASPSPGTAPAAGYGSPAAGGPPLPPQWTVQPSGDVNPYQAPYATEASWQRPRHNGLAVASFVLGICSLPLLCCCGAFGLPISVAGLALGIAGLRSQDRGMAIAGIVLSSIGLLLALMLGAFMVFSIVMGN